MHHTASNFRPAQRTLLRRCRNVWATSRFVCAAVFVGSALTVAAAGQVDYGALGNFIRVPSGAAANTGALVRLGVFDPAFDFAANAGNFDATSSAFTEFDTSTIGAGGSEPGQFYEVTLVTTSAVEGRQLYIWIFDSAAGGSGSAWVILTNPNWRVPVEGDFTIIDTSDPGTIVPSGARGTMTPNADSPNGVDWRMQGGQAPTPTPTATPSPAPTATPTATPSASPTASPTPSVPPSPSPSPSANPSPSVTPSPSPSPSPASHLANISTRLRVGTADNVLIAGFILQGTGEKRLIVRGIGPSLTLDGRLMDPVLELFDNGGNELAENDRWQDDVNAIETQESTLAPTDPNEPALLRRLLSADTTLYTAVISGKNGTTGIGLVEVYDLDQNGPVQIVNIATRGFVQTEDDAMIGGVIVTGEAEAEVVVRAIGPSLTVNNKLADPVLGLFNNDGDPIFVNDDWKANQQEAIESSGLAPQNESESAIRISLKPGNYTAIVRGKNDSTGVAVVEVYKLSR